MTFHHCQRTPWWWMRTTGPWGQRQGSGPGSWAQRLVAPLAAVTAGQTKPQPEEVGMRACASQKRWSTTVNGSKQCKQKLHRYGINFHISLDQQTIQTYSSFDQSAESNIYTNNHAKFYEHSDKSFTNKQFRCTDVG
jgi:hypothetical protein